MAIDVRQQAELQPHAPAQDHAILDSTRRRAVCSAADRVVWSWACS